MRSITVVGASLAGLSTVRALRTEGFDGDIVVVGEERHAPYDRPPLSKDFLKGDIGADALALSDTEEYDELQARWLLGERAVRLDTAARSVTLAGGREVPTDGIVIATGASPRTLPGTDGMAGVHTLRTLDDAQRAARRAAGRPAQGRRHRRRIHRCRGGVHRPPARPRRHRGRGARRTTGTPTGARHGAGVLLAPHRSRGAPAVRNRRGGIHRPRPGHRRAAGGRAPAARRHRRRRGGGAARHRLARRFRRHRGRRRGVRRRLRDQYSGRGRGR